MFQVKNALDSSNFDFLQIDQDLAEDELSGWDDHFWIEHKHYMLKYSNYSQQVKRKQQDFQIKKSVAQIALISRIFIPLKLRSILAILLHSISAHSGQKNVRALSEFC